MTWLEDELYWNPECLYGEEGCTCAEELKEEAEREDG